MKLCHVCNFQCNDDMENCPICGADLTAEADNQNIENQENDNSVEPVLIATLNDVFAAEIFKDILKENNIIYFCDEDADNGGMKVVFGGGFAAQDIYVDKTDFEKANELYMEFLKSEQEFVFDDEFTDGEDL